MKKFVLCFMFLFAMIFISSGISHAWQGRMAGMDDPYGLIADESDYLIHVADIAKGQGVKFYGGYRFNYTNVTTWETELGLLDAAAASEKFNFAGKELKHEALMGSSFALGSGRMGVFFAYDGKRGNFNADLVDQGTGGRSKDDLDNFALRFMYGIPVGNFNFGAEAGIAYKKEKSDINLFFDDHGGESGYYNYLEAMVELSPEMPPFIPYDSTYWEIPLKVGFSGKMGPVDTKFTMRGGIIVAGDNKLKLGYYEPSREVYDNLDGDTKGWSIGADLWMRYQIDNGLSLPFMVRADYQKKTRDARGFLVNLTGTFLDYETEETALNLTLGGGVEKAFSQNTRLATGLYYSYINDKKDSYGYSGSNEGEYELELFYDDFPNMTEHRVTLRLAGEHALSPAVTLRAGMGLFYGSVKQDLDFGINYVSTYRTELKFSSDGTRRGIGASLGASVKLTAVTLEPFINAGYQSMKLSGGFYRNGVLSPELERVDTREQWYAGGGLAVIFGQ